MKTRSVLSLVTSVGVILTSAPASAAASDASANEQQSASAPSAADLQAESQEIQSLWQGKKIAEAMVLLQRRAASAGFHSAEQQIQTEYLYALACGSSLLGRPDEAVAYLGMAVGSGFKDFGQLSSDHDLDPVRQNPGFLVLQEAVRSQPTHLAILRQHGKYAHGVAFAYQSKEDPDLTRLRQTWNLESVAGNGDDASRVLNLLHWVHSQVRHDGNSENPQPSNALHILEVCKKEGRGVNCRMMATILNEVCLSLGYKARHVTCLPLDRNDTDCHVITAVWLDGPQKWVYLDPTFDAYFTDPQGALLSVPEVRARMIKGETMTLSKGANWNGEKEDPDKYLDYMAKNLVKLQCPQQSSFGYESTKGRKSYVELDDASIAPGTSANTAYIHDPELFWAPP